MPKERAGTTWTIRRLNPLDIDLDPHNPRIPLSLRNEGLSQGDLLRILNERFKLEDLGRSIAASGYTDLDPLIGYEDGDQIVVREGNRRIGALKLLIEPNLAPARYLTRWKELATQVRPEDAALMRTVDMRVFDDPESADLEAYIGFRHVSGVLEWPAEEKARFIVEMVDRHGWSYMEISERIGSYPKHVERHYIASRLMEQASKLEIPGADHITIGVLLRALQARGVSEFLGVEYPGEPLASREPVPENKLEDLAFFVRVAFGTAEQQAILPESRQLTKLGKILQSEEAVRYLKAAARPNFDRAWAKSGGEQTSVLEMLEAAADNLEDSLPLVVDYKNSREIVEAVDRCARRLHQLLRDFPDIEGEWFGSSRVSR